MFSSVSAVALITARFVPGIVSLCCLCLLAVELVLTSVHSIKKRGEHPEFSVKYTSILQTTYLWNRLSFI